MPAITISTLDCGDSLETEGVSVEAVIDVVETEGVSVEAVIDVVELIVVAVAVIANFTGSECVT